MDICGSRQGEEQKNSQSGKNRKLTEKILAYWFTLEFLGQDRYPHKELTEAFGAAKELKERLRKGRKGYKFVSDFVTLQPQQSLSEAIRQEARMCRMKKWGKITVYIGKVQREACIKCFEDKIPFAGEKEKRPEKSFDDIACLSLQLSPEGRYVPDSLSLSTIVWAMKQVADCRGRQVECLDEAVYQSAVEELERRFLYKKRRRFLSTEKNILRSPYSWPDYMRQNSTA